MAKADPCGALIDSSDVTVTIECSGQITFNIPDAKFSNTYSVSVEHTSGSLVSSGLSTAHATSLFKPGGQFVLTENCGGNNTAPLSGNLPTWSAGSGSGTYKFTGGKLALIANANPELNTEDVLSKPTVSLVKVTKPSCSGVSDGQIELKVTIPDGPTKCVSGLMYSFTSLGSGFKPVPATGIIVEAGIGAGMETFTFTAVSPSDIGCVCTTPVPDPFKVTIAAPAENSASIACIDRVNMSASVDPNDCTVTIELSDIMLGVGDPCTDNDMAEYINVRDPKTNELIGIGLNAAVGTPPYVINTETGSGAAVRLDASAYFGQEVIVEVHDAMSQNYCWGTVLIEDKAPPVISCEGSANDTILCIDFRGDMAEAMRNTVASDCTPDPEVTIVRQKTLNECGGSVMKQVELIYYAEDDWKNKSENCLDTIYIKRIGRTVGKKLHWIDGITLNFPPDYEQSEKTAFSCEDFVDRDGDGAPDPVSGSKGAGMPFLEIDRSIVEDGTGIDSVWLPDLNYAHYSNDINKLRSDAFSYCKIGATYSDIRLGSYDCVTKYMRTWTVYEWTCDGEIDTSFTQVIEIADTLAPTFLGNEVADATVSVNTYNCSKEKEIKMPTATDNCTPSDEIEYQAVVYDSTWRVIGPDIKDGYMFDFPLGRNYVVYTAFDACHNFALDTAIVDVVDKTAPVTICKEFLVVGISADGTVRVPSTSFDNGSYDDCALDKTCVVRMDDLDTFDALDAADAYPNDGWVLMSTIERELLACDRDFSGYSTEREIGKDKAFYLHRDDLCQKDIWFCCLDDQNSTDEQPTSSDEDVMVVFRAIDHYGNSNECMVFVDIQDKTRPSIICPPSVTVDCDLPLPSISESILGTFIDISQDPLAPFFGTIAAEHEGQPFGIHLDHVLSADKENLVDGTYFDNCRAPSIFVKTDMAFDKCNTGIITRTFYAQDGSGNRSSQCTQTITVNSTVEFDYKNIKWPVDDTLMTTCMKEEDITATMFGVPTAPDGACMLFGTSYDDQVFRFNNQENPDSEACFKLIRTWNVIDWCNKDYNGGSSYVISYKQIIKVNDPDGPVIACSADTITETLDCEGATVELSATASDECTTADEMFWQAKIDANNDGSFDFKFEDLQSAIETGVNGTESVATITMKFPLGTHRIQWVAEDRCGNREICESLFTVTLTKAPTPFAVDVSTVLMSTGMVAIWADDLNNKSEGSCGIEGVEVAIARNPSVFADAASSITFTCDDFVNGPRVAIDFYAYQDLGGGNVISDYTTVYVTLQDNSGACDGVTPSESQNAFIAGNIRTESAANVPDIEVGLLGGNQAASALDATVTDTKGQYAFPAMPMGGEYVIDPVSATDYLNGVTTLDLVLIQRYVLGLADLPSAYKIIAADINKDNNISAIDLVDLRSVILGIRDEFVNNESWRFVDATYEFADATNPLAETFSESYTISELTSDMTVDFVGVKVGDVNGSADAASTLAQSRSKFNVSVADQNFNSGDIIQVPLKVSSAIELLGFQFTTSFSSNKLQFAGIDAAGVDFTPENLGTNQLAEGILTASWNDVKGTNLAGDEAIITLNFKAIASGTLSESFSINSDVTTAEIYNTNLETMNISLNFTKETTALASGFELGQNTPNPFAENTMISFTLPTAANATVTVFDVTGKVLKLTKGSFDKGLNTIEISKNELASSGVLYYTLETDGFTDTKRMVVLK